MADGRGVGAPHFEVASPVGMASGSSPKKALLEFASGRRRIARLIRFRNRSYQRSSVTYMTPIQVHIKALLESLVCWINITDFHTPRRTIYNMSALPIYDRIRLMQLLAISAGRGLIWWTSGRVRIERITAFVAKMTDRHGINADRSEQRRQRVAGLPRTRLMILKPKDGDTHAEWWMIATSYLSGETMRDATQRDSRIGLGAYFELVRLTTRGNGTGWTWRVKPADWATFQRRGMHYARARNKEQAQKFIEGLAKWPGAAGLNAQRRELFRKMQGKAKGKLMLPRIVYPRFLSFG